MIEQLSAKLVNVLLKRQNNGKFSSIFYTENRYKFPIFAPTIFYTNVFN